MFYQHEILPSHTQNQEGLLVGLLEDNWQENPLYDETEELLLHALTPQVERWSLFLFWLSQNFVTFSQNYPLDLVGYLRSFWRELKLVLQLLKGQEAGLSPGYFQVGLYQSDEGSQLEVGMTLGGVQVSFPQQGWGACCR